jgi:hypothetical protein
MSMTASERLRVVYLTGSGHTGSTLLALFLDAHPRIVSVGETSFKRKVQRRGSTELVCTCGAPYSACPFWQQVFRGVAEAGFELSAGKWSNDFRYKGRLAHRLLSRYSAHPVFRTVQRAAAAVLPGHGARVEQVRRVNVEFIRTVLRLADADVFFDTSKRAMRLHHLLDTPQLDVRVVKLVRDVRGYVSSAKRRGESVSEAALAWRRAQESIEHLTRTLPADRMMLLRYEDVCRDPRTWLKRTYAFCGVEAIDPPDAVVSGEHHVIGNNMRRSEQIRIRLDESWRTGLSTEEQARVLAIAGPLPARFGYAQS